MPWSSSDWDLCKSADMRLSLKTLGCLQLVRYFPSWQKKHLGEMTVGNLFSVPLSQPFKNSLLSNLSMGHSSVHLKPACSFFCPQRKWAIRCMCFGWAKSPICLPKLDHPPVASLYWSHFLGVHSTTTTHIPSLFNFSANRFVLQAGTKCTS